jgi:hypothetical protein
LASHPASFTITNLLSMEGSSMTARSFLRLNAALVLCTMATNAGSAAQTSMSGIYSDLHYNSEGGDLLGMELLILPGEGAGWTVVAQIAEGGAPCVSVASLRVTGRNVEFVLPKGGQCGEVHFRGKLIGQDIQLSHDSGSIEYLKRGKSYWQ